MTRPTRYLVRICVFLLIILGIVFALRGVLLHAFMVNPGLNGVIIAILLLGIAWNLHLTIRLIPEVRWVNILQQPREGLRVPEPPLLLAPMARLLRARREEDPKLALSPQTTRAMLESLEARMDEGREISRYITQLLVFLGLLGTFYGLILTVRSVADVISAMPSGGADLAGMFEHIKTGLTKPLVGMSTAFSASMFGLAGSLILGFLDLTSGQAQNRFANEIEEWLADLTFLDSPVNTPSPSAYSPAQMEELMRTNNAAIIAKLDELNATLRQVREPLRQPLAPLEDMLYQLDEKNQATLQTLQNLTSNLKQHQMDDPTMAHLIQEMGQKLASLRGDIVHLFQRDHKTRSTQRRED
ncbi:MotA/TolQ/ExbB proton channel family protein [Bombella saccharophila]|uniref:MotA/TolQ/ExbB proton channel family protein n=1 Tax=Bombella saccharophila TaxID=2967338 RepID=A0ABT3W7V2_9PROT|nr:MotA/TolQ/ExbB proton channel family protein [Bombella saccharophila]MCX5615159.1 MotA/TolQ/ExbB proton channel family protein [Bombella saccharophila]